jgi:hypothetical protein
VFLVLAMVAAGMRFANSFYATGRYGWDDRFLALAWVCPCLANLSLAGLHRLLNG